MEPPSDTERWAKIATALASPIVKTQSQVWELERRQMLDIVSRFWAAEAVNFRNFVEDPANAESLSAIVLTSLEDVPQVRVFTLAYSFARLPTSSLTNHIDRSGFHWSIDGCMLSRDDGRRGLGSAPNGAKHNESTFNMLFLTHFADITMCCP